MRENLAFRKSGVKIKHEYQTVPHQLVLGACCQTQNHILVHCRYYNARTGELDGFQAILTKLEFVRCRVIIMVECLHAPRRDCSVLD